MAWPSLDTLSYAANVAVVALTVMAAIAGVAALVFSNRLARQKQAARVTLQADVRRRSLTADQRATLEAALRRLPKTPIRVASLKGDGETASLAAEILDILASAGWSDPVSRSLPISGHPTGLKIRVHDGAAPPAIAGAVQQAFRSIGFDAAGSPDPNMPPDIIEIFVAAKP